MIFRKDSLLFYQCELFCVVLTILCLTLIPILGLEVSLLFIIPFIVLILVTPKLYNEFIIMDEIGISCHKSGKQLWKYEWNDVAELRSGSRFLLPSIEVIIYSKNKEPECFALPNQYFQLGRIAKDALNRYYKTTK